MLLDNILYKNWFGYKNEGLLRTMNFYKRIEMILPYGKQKIFVINYKLPLAEQTFEIIS